MKFSKLIDPNFKTAFNKLMMQELPLKAATKLRTIHRKIDNALTQYEKDRETALLKYGDKKEDGTLDIDENSTVKLSGPNKDGFIADMNNLLNSELEMETLKIEELGHSAKLSTQDLILLEDLLTE